MLIERVFTPGFAQVAYLVADEPAREVAVIDPRRDVDEYVDWADAARVPDRRDPGDPRSCRLRVRGPGTCSRTGAPVYASRFG